MPPQELTFGDWNTDTQTSSNVDIQGDTFTLAEAIPSSVVSRPADNNSFNISSGAARGIQIETSVEWSEFGGRLSSNTPSDPTRAYIYRVSDGQLMGDTDISTLSGGDTFTINLSTNLVSGETYNFVVDAGGNAYTFGYYDSPTFPYTSSDGNLSIVNGAANTTGTDGNANAIVDAGFVGF